MHADSDMPRETRTAGEDVPAETTGPLDMTHKPESAAWLDKVKSYYWIHNILNLHRELTFWLIRWDGGKYLDWMELAQPISAIQPFHFEIFHGKESRRDAHYLKTMRRAARERRLIVADLHGFSDLFCPISADPKRRTFLHAGQFYTQPVTWEGICASWQEISGQAPAGGNPDFVRFVRMALQVPVIEPVIMNELERFLTYYADLLTGQETTQELHGKIDELRRTVFVRHWPNLDWMDAAISSEKFRLTPWYHEGQLRDWMREEMKISRLPTTILALMPLDSPEESMDPLQIMVRNHHIQRECIRYSFDMPETGATKLQDYGVVFLTSTDPKKSAASARLELRERARKIQAFVRERFGVRSVVGIGSTLPPGEALYPSYHEAVLALHLCVQLEKDVLFYDEKYSERKQFKYADLNHSANQLSEAFDRVSTNQMKVASDQYVRMVLIYSNERIEAVRSHFLAMLFRLIGNVQRRHSLRPATVEQFASELSLRLEEASSVYQLIESFKEVMQRLSFYASRALEGPKSIRLAATLQYLEDNFAEPLRLPDVARQAGFSVPAFSRVFRQATGTSFLAYLRGIRVEHAKMLLRTTSLSTAQIAIACGFQSPHHLIRSFRKVTNQTPGEYRRWVAARKGREPVAS